MNAPVILDSVCPLYDARERHEVIISAPAAAGYAALHTADFTQSRLVRALLSLRALPFLFSGRGSRPQPLRFSTGVGSILDAGFGLIAEEPDHEIVLGLGGAFWRLRPRTYPLDHHSARAGPGRGMAHAMWNFRVESLAHDRTLLSTETRVLTGDSGSRRRFRLYWILVRPFSGLIRRIMLATIRREAERAHRVGRPR